MTGTQSIEPEEYEDRLAHMTRQEAIDELERDRRGLMRGLAFAVTISVVGWIVILTAVYFIRK